MQQRRADRVGCKQRSVPCRRQFASPRTAASMCCRLSRFPRPTPGPGEVLIRVKAAGINPGESKIRQGLLRERFPATFPSGQGSDLAGVVDELGPDVRGIAVGDEMIGFTNNRASQAEFVTVAAADLTPRPPGVSWEGAGSLFVAGAP